MKNAVRFLFLAAALNYGAIHIGQHRFYKKLPDGKEQLVEVSQFTNLWKQEGGSWKLTRVLSYDHRDAR